MYIRPTYVVSLPEYSGGSSVRTIAQRANEVNLKDNSHKGVLSCKAIGKMKNAINWLLCAAEPKKVYHKKSNRFFDFRVNFITVTLPDTAKEISNRAFQEKLLNPYLTYLRKYYDLNNYVWKLEFQKNGKLHAHITADTFIHHRVLRTAWNRLLITNGYMAMFEKKFGHSDPNSTDVHSVRKIRNLGAYLAKYMTKNAADLIKIKGRIWGCSQSLSRAGETACFLFPEDCREHLSPLMQNGFKWKSLGTIDKITGLWKSHGEVFFLTYVDWQQKMSGLIHEQFLSVVAGLRPARSDTAAVYYV